MCETTLICMKILCDKVQILLIVTEVGIWNGDGSMHLLYNESCSCSILYAYGDIFRIPNVYACIAEVQNEHKEMATIFKGEPKD